jgi:hypothetical protein
MAWLVHTLLLKIIFYMLGVPSGGGCLQAARVGPAAPANAEACSACHDRNLPATQAHPSCLPSAVLIPMPLQLSRCLSWRRTRATPSRPPAPRCWCSWSQVRDCACLEQCTAAAARGLCVHTRLMCPPYPAPSPHRRRERAGIPCCVGLWQPVHGCVPGAHPEAGHTAGGAHLQ